MRARSQKSAGPRNIIILPRGSKADTQAGQTRVGSEVVQQVQDRTQQAGSKPIEEVTDRPIGLPYPWLSFYTSTEFVIGTGCYTSLVLLPVF
jgi:hypothetical protein